MKEYVGLRAETSRYLQDNNDENKETKGTKTCVTKTKLRL